MANLAGQWRGEHVVNFYSEATHVSWALQHNRGFSDPYFSGPSGPTAQMAPLYPSLHAVVCLVFGTGRAGWAAIVALTALAWSLQWTFAYDFMQFYGHAKAGLGAALMGVLVPLPDRLFKWEAVFAACALAAGACLVARLLEKPHRAWSCLFGLTAAAAVLLTPATAIVFVVWGVYLLRRGPLRQAVNVLTIAVLCAILPISLWTARNYRTFGHLFFIRDDAGFALRSSNLDCAKAVLTDNLASGCFATTHPSASPLVLAELRQQGEYNLAARQMGDTVQWALSHPARFVTLTLERIGYFWFPLERSDEVVFLNGILMSLATVLSFLSLLWRRCPGFAILAGALACFPAVYYFAQFGQRYRYPVLWMSILLSAVGVELALRRWAEIHREKLLSAPPPSRRIPFDKLAS